MLLTCPECELQVSDKAIRCPHCGYPLSGESKKSSNPRTKKRLRLPNGFGQITKISGKNLRKPYRVMITVGKNEVGRPITQLLKPEAYFETYNEAYAALVEHHKNPYSIDNNVTLIELYERWTADYFRKLKSKSSERTITSAWNKCTNLYYMRVADIRAYHLKNLILNSDATNNIKGRMKSLFNIMLDFAVEYEIVQTNVARTFTLTDHMEIKEDPKEPHITFTQEELNILWDHTDDRWVRIVLIQMYSGLRPQELGLVLLENVDIENWSIIGGMKTNAGIDRFVPIHTLIRDFVKSEYNFSKSQNSPYLFTCDDSITHRSSKKLTYDKYRHRFDTVVKDYDLNLDHRPHDPRKTFVTMAKKAGMDEYAIKYIVGHKIKDITEKVYTERDPEWLRTEIEKIKRETL